MTGVMNKSILAIEICRPYSPDILDWVVLNDENIPRYGISLLKNAVFGHI